jgi:Zn-dependent membrane protease YugP
MFFFSGLATLEEDRYFLGFIMIFLIAFMTLINLSIVLFDFAFVLKLITVNIWNKISYNCNKKMEKMKQEQEMKRIEE